MDWDPDEPADDSRGYCTEANRRGEEDMNRLMDSLRSLVLGSTEVEVQDTQVGEEWEGNVDREWRDVE